MDNAATNSQPNAGWPPVRSGPLITGGIVIGIGVTIALAGLAIAGSHVVAATRTWSKELEIPPSQLAKLKWEQAKTGGCLGREHLAGPPERPGTPASPWRHSHVQLSRALCAQIVLS